MDLAVYTNGFKTALKQRSNKQVLSSFTQINVLSSKNERNLWDTPRKVFDKLDEEFKFTIKLCFSSEGAKHQGVYSTSMDELKREWSGEKIFCDLYYCDKIDEWITKCYEESRRSDTLVVMLVPLLNDSSCINNVIYRYARQVRFVKDESNRGRKIEDAIYPSAIVIF